MSKAEAIFSLCVIAVLFCLFSPWVFTGVLAVFLVLYFALRHEQRKTQEKWKRRADRDRSHREWDRAMLFAARVKGPGPITGNERADRLIREKPSCWEFYLTEELLTSGLRTIRKRLGDLQRGLVPVQTRLISEKEFLQSASVLSREYVSVVNHLTRLTNEELAHAWGLRGTAGNAASIERAVNEILEQCQRAYQWEVNLRAWIVPPEYTRIQRGLLGWGDHVLRGTETIADKLTTILAGPLRDGSHYNIAVTIPDPPNVNMVCTEIQRLNADTNAKIRAGRASADNVAAAALLGGLVGWYAGNHFFKPHTSSKCDL